MTRENDMRTRAEDQTGPMPLDGHTSTHSLKVVREIPMWGILGVMGVLGAQAVAMYYGQQALSEKMVEVRTEVRNLTLASNARERDTIELRSDMGVLRARVDDNQRRVEDLVRRLADVERKGR